MNSRPCGTRGALLALMSLVVSASALGQSADVARMVVWKMKPGMSRNFEEGYKRHLEWHRRNHDPWTWRGWMVSFGERSGYFVDGTFFHSWKDLDSPVSPAADSADNEVNVFPYGEVISSVIVESVSALTNIGEKDLSASIVSFYYLEIRPGASQDFESMLGSVLWNSSVRHAVLRPAIGTTEYFLLLFANKPSDLGNHAEVLSKISRMATDEKGDSLIAHYRTETARYRQDMSYVPANAP